jgi:hypothetical protein
MTATFSTDPRNTLKRPFISRLFNVFHYSTVALLVGSSLFLTVNVVGAALAKRKSFRAEIEQARTLAETKAEATPKD